MVSTAAKLGVAVAGIGLIKKMASDKPGSKAAPTITFSGVDTRDYRAKLKIPQSYLDTMNGETSSVFTDKIKASGGIVFPYTPGISYEMSAAYSNQNPMHSNYAQHFYKHSQVSNINLNAKFTVQSDEDAGMYLTIKHLLSALTKMRTANDKDAGAPPPVCRLCAYGDYMFQNVPVTIGSVRIELPEDIDYYLVTRKNDPSSTNSAGYVYGTNNFVPTRCTFSMTLIPMYSRNELLNFGVDQFLSGNLHVAGAVKGFI